jgi:hypothetical protein
MPVTVPTPDQIVDQGLSWLLGNRNDLIMRDLLTRHGQRPGAASRMQPLDLRDVLCWLALEEAATRLLARKGDLVLRARQMGATWSAIAAAVGEPMPARLREDFRIWLGEQVASWDASLASGTDPQGLAPHEREDAFALADADQAADPLFGDDVIADMQVAELTADRIAGVIPPADAEPSADVLPAELGEQLAAVVDHVRELAAENIRAHNAGEEHKPHQDCGGEAGRGRGDDRVDLAAHGLSDKAPADPLPIRAPGEQLAVARILAPAPRCGCGASVRCPDHTAELVETVRRRRIAPAPLPDVADVAGGEN